MGNRPFDQDCSPGDHCHSSTYCEYPDCAYWRWYFYQQSNKWEVLKILALGYPVCIHPDKKSVWLVGRGGDYSIPTPDTQIVLDLLSAGYLKKEKVSVVKQKYKEECHDHSDLTHYTISARGTKALKEQDHG